MVVESLINPFALKKRPWEMFFVGALYSLVGFFLSYLVFPSASSLLMVFFVVVAAVPILYKTILNEEQLDIQFDKEIFMLREHSKVLLYLMFFFLGVTFMFVLLHVFMPQNIVETTFFYQEETLSSINAPRGTGSAFQSLLFQRILFNNIKVLFFCIIFSFLFGTGALFILAWNASVIAAAAGNLIKSMISGLAQAAGFTSIGHYFTAFYFGFGRYFTHGVWEIAAYWIAGLAGGIISVAVIRHNLRDHKVLLDATELIMIALGVLVFAAWVEVFVTPKFF